MKDMSYAQDRYITEKAAALDAVYKEKVKQNEFCAKKIIDFLETDDVSGLVSFFKPSEDELSSKEDLDEVIKKPEIQNKVKEKIFVYLQEDLAKAGELLRLSDSFLISLEVQVAVREKLIDCLQKGRMSEARDLVGSLFEKKLPDSIVDSPDVQAVARERMIAGLRVGELDMLELITWRLKKPPDVVIASPEVQTAAKAGLVVVLRKGGTHEAVWICEEFKIPEAVLLSPEVQDAAKEGLIWFLNSIQLRPAITLRNKFKISDLVLNSLEVQTAIKKSFASCLKSDLINLAVAIRNEFNIPEAEVDVLLGLETVDLLQKNKLDMIVQIFDEFYPSDSILDPQKVILMTEKAVVASLLDGNFRMVNRIKERFSIRSGQDWQTFFEDETIPVNIRHERAAYVSDLSPAARRARLTHCLAPDEYRDIEKDSSESLKLQGESPDWPKVADALVERMKKGKEDASIVEAFEACVNLFDAKNIMVYLNRPSLSRHDGLHFASELISLYRNSGLSAEAFSGNILLQVARDDAEYDEGSAHHRLDQICLALSKTSPQDILQAASNYPNIDKLQSLVGDFSKSGGASGAFASWKNLKKLAEINDLLKRGQILEKLNSGGISPRLRQFVQTTAFHPGVDGGAVIQFMERPAEFLAVDDKHDSLKVHQDKKPSNYVSLPYLGLTAENLRDAYVEGKIDQLQTLPPMERTYVLSDEGSSEEKRTFTPAELVENLRLALGSGGNKALGLPKTPGLAQSPKKLFSEVRNFCSKYSINFAKLISVENGEETLTASSPESIVDLTNIIFRGKNNEFGMARPSASAETYRIRIGQKSDPEMVVAGNDTASCMPFGSGKNNVYTFNPNCGQLIVERKTAEGWKTAAQSVVSLDLDTGKPTPELVKAYTSKQSSLKDLLAPEIFLTPSIVTCDNIEIAKNEEGRRSAAIMECYRRFFTAYLADHAAEKGWNATKVAVGTGYTPKDLPGLDKVSNTVIPFAPMGYSDNIHADRFEIKTGLPKAETKLKIGISPMEVTDTLAVSWLEGKAFAANESLLYNLHHMQNNIIGQAIAGQFFERPNLSFVSRSDQGIPVGYLLAYEGRSDQTPMIFVSDIAVDPGAQGKGAGGQLMQRFMKEFAANYGTEQRPFLPVFANLRESTSYPILKNSLGRLASSNGLVAEMVEIKKRSQGGETFYDVFLIFGKTQADIDKQKATIGEIDLSKE